MAEVDHFSAAGLQYAPHDIDGGIVPVEKGCSRDNPDMVFRFIRFG